MDAMTGILENESDIRYDVTIDFDLLEAKMRTHHNKKQTYLLLSGSLKMGNLKNVYFSCKEEKQYKRAL